MAVHWIPSVLAPSRWCSFAWNSGLLRVYWCAIPGIYANRAT